MKHMLTALFVVSLAATASAQLTATVGPEIVPFGCDVYITFANDTATTVSYGDGCPYTVKDVNGAIVYSIQCPMFVAVNVAPGATSTTLPWSQVDNNFTQVPAGLYFIDVTLPDGTVSAGHLVQVGLDDAAVSLLGVHRPGTTRNLALCAPNSPNDFYVMAAALSTGSSLTACGEIFPLANDALLQISIAPNNVFLNFTGYLDAIGRTQAPAIAVPNIPTLSGIGFKVAFAVFDFQAGCPVSKISAVQDIVIQ